MSWSSYQNSLLGIPYAISPLAQAEHFAKISYYTFSFLFKTAELGNSDL